MGLTGPSPHRALLCALLLAPLAVHAEAAPPSQSTLVVASPVPQVKPPCTAAATPVSPDVQPCDTPAPAPVVGGAPIPHAAAPPREALAGEIIVQGHVGAPPGDPAQKLNEKSFAAVQFADHAVVGPAAAAYRKVLPNPLQQGIHNGLYNLREPAVFAAFVMQHRIGKAGETLARFAINSTIGVAGLIDVAKRRPFHLPRRANGLADTMAFYGVGPGPYMFLPVIGPTTLRDLVGVMIDRMTLPMLIGAPFNKPPYSLSIAVVGGLDDRVAQDDDLKRLMADPHPYAAVREAYLADRRQEIAGLHRHKTAAPAGNDSAR